MPEGWSIVLQVGVAMLSVMKWLFAMAWFLLIRQIYHSCAYEMNVNHPFYSNWFLLFFVMNVSEKNSHFTKSRFTYNFFFNYAVETGLVESWIKTASNATFYVDTRSFISANFSIFLGALGEQRFRIEQKKNAWNCQGYVCVCMLKINSIYSEWFSQLNNWVMVRPVFVCKSTTVYQFSAIFSRVLAIL